MSMRNHFQNPNCEHVSTILNWTIQPEGFFPQCNSNEMLDFVKQQKKSFIPKGLLFNII